MSFDLSVIIPTYKRSDSLLLIIEKLQLQKNVAVEIIVVDQNGADFFSEDMLDLLKTVKRVRQKKPNASTARNNGFLHATAPYVLFIDDDLVPDENFCSHGLNVFKQYPNIKCFSPNVYNHQGKDVWLSYAKLKEIQNKKINKDCFAITDTMSACIFFEKDYYKQSGGMDPYLFDFARTAEDQEFFLRMMNRNQTLWFVNSVAIFHNEKVAGGCDLRTDDYWNTRKRCINSWALRYRLHHKNFGKLSFSNLFALMRSSFLNGAGLKQGIKPLFKNMQLMKAALSESKTFLQQHSAAYNKAQFNYLKNEF